MRRIKTKPVDEAERKLAEFMAAVETIRSVRQELEASNDASAPLADQLFHWYRVRQYYEAVKEVSIEAEKLSRFMSYEQLPSAFRSSRVNARSITLDNIGRFSLGSRTTARVHNQEHANTFLRNNGKGDALREMTPAATMNSIVAELIKTGVEPDRDKDGIEANTYSYTSFTKVE
jgi:hypothetical protein